MKPCEGGFLTVMGMSQKISKYHTLQQNGWVDHNMADRGNQCGESHDKSAGSHSDF